MATEIKLNRLNQAGSLPAGVAWGVPWKEGELGRQETLHLAGEKEGGLLPVQSWPAAFWPDGSVKWSAHAAVIPEGEGGFFLARGAAPESASRVKVTETDEEIAIDTGVIRFAVGRSGENWLREVWRKDDRICSGGDLVCLKEERNEGPGIRTVTETAFGSVLDKAVVEQDGPVRAVLKLEGRHRSQSGNGEWLPFVLRFSFYAGLDSIRLVYTFFYDGREDSDFIKGLGIRLDVPMNGPLYNRHIRLAGDQGFFSESPKTLHTRRTKGKYRELFEKQTRGEKVIFHEEEDAYFLGLLEDSATWGSFKLVQDSSEHYRLSKRTKEGCSWVKAAEGRRAGGLAYVGGTQGGLAAGLRGFWEMHPAGFEVQGADGRVAALTVWFWSPDAAPMDLRHYDTETHVESSYEGAEELRATPYGIGHTSELTIWATGSTPDPALLERMREEAQSPSLLVCEPEYYHETGAFGYWSLPDRSHPVKALLEDRLEGIVSFYQREVEQRKWYGFWDFGDFMHSYDPVRHVWNYDLGGCAWQNTELAPNMWLWVMFLRTGRADIFRMAEAMTRHTSEVDVYHFGEYAGLGSRHNVVHWGCGCKEARIAMAGLHRYYFYLTADGRIGDILDEVKDSDFSTVNLDPMRAYFPKDEHPTHVRVGPDWAAFSSNWMTRWERYEDTAYRDKIVAGIDCIKQANYRLISGPTYGYYPETGKLVPMGDDNYGRHLAICMGGPQVWFELARMLKDAEWEDMMAELGVYYNKSQEEKDLLTKGAVSTSRFEHPVLSVAIAAFGAYYTKDERTGRLCWAILAENPFARVHLQDDAVPVTHVDRLQEIDWMNTNEAAQWSLNTIISLDLIADTLPKELKEWNERKRA
ncbi:hypothetical protein MJA45_17935 [Paenibacillus aurantius]|uniref:Tat pathway signal sequence domain protein n=1 Tax=Paenibacillus aurantius TaxID=2918900 RepID=A0AA96RBJ4_9BACL|nr:hypothetical protein [Paenibacillus aurantius]WNQ09505.1 hypothetical protein MJA45_17935 [Paenibacillus aurantius]